MTEHKHGSMDIEYHKQVYQGFVKWLIRIGIVIALILIYLAIFRT